MAKPQAQRFWRSSVRLLIVLAVAIVATEPARAQAPGDLYQAMVIVTGTDMRSRPSGFAQCLREVLVKVSGEPRLQNDPRVAALAAHADALVHAFDYVDPRAAIRHHDDQGTYDRSYNLTVHFDPALIDKALASLGEQPWRGERPTVVPVLVVRGFGPPYTQTYLLTSEEPAASVQRASFANAAAKYGIALSIPAAAELAAWHVSTDGFPPLPAAPVSNEAIVAGTLEFQPAAFGWIGSWRLHWHDADYAWGIKGVSFDAAFDDLVRGTVRVVSGHGAPD